MAFQSLSTRLNSLPLVLAGPILRQVTETRVTVWVAVRKKASITLTVTDDKNKPLLEGSADTTAIGKSLHVVAITAKPLPNIDKLTEGHIYLYNLGFGDLFDITTATKQARLAYPPYKVPSFCLPPKDLNKLRIVHGSCRKPHGEGADALPLLDDFIAANPSDPYQRPHQLLLTGDQIYADDVADVLLRLLNDAGNVLLGWDETLDTTPIKSPIPIKSWPSYYRLAILLNAQFTSDDLKSHLVTLGDFFAMYLFVWSSVLWPDSLPTFDDINSWVLGLAGHAADKMTKYMKRQKDTIEKELKYVTGFKSTLDKVRCALANVPTYMICDDHEVTDDWNMTRRFCKQVYGTPVGMRVVQNGLVAFSICQAWGNDPDRFTTSPATAGSSLLKKLASVSAGQATYDSVSGDLQTLVGVHNAATVLSAGRVFHDNEDNVAANAENPVSLRFNFRVEGPGHLIIVTDTRTWRAFPVASDDAHGDFLESTRAKSELTRQFALSKPLDDRLLVVILTTNAPPIASFRYAASHPLFVDVAGNPGDYLGKVFEAVDLTPPAFPKPLSGAARAIYENDLYDSWELPSGAFDRLMVQLDSMLQAQKRTQQVVLLSGDVHSSFASRLTVFSPAEDGILDQPRMVVAQIVASSLKNQTEKTRGQQLEGYTYAPKEIARHWVPDFEPESFDGPYLTGDPSNTGSLYRLDYLVANPGQTAGQAIPDPLTIKEGDDIANLRTYAKMQSYGNVLIYYGASPLQIIGHNNIAELKFVWGTDKRARHIVHWIGASGKSFVTTYDISLNLNDPKYPPLPVNTPDPVGQ